MEFYDVVVAGGGPAGVAAAIAAARNGKKVLLIEKEGYLGGMAASALVPAFCPFTDGKNLLAGGIGLEILMELKKECFVSPFYDRKPDRIEGIDWYPIDSEALKRVLDRMVLESGCHILLHTMVIDCQAQGNELTHITIFNKEGTKKIYGSVFIDCSGDGDLTAMAGGPFQYGDEKGRVQAGTLCFKISNFDVDRFMEYARATGEDGNLNQAVKRAKANGDFPDGENKVAGMSITGPGTASLNFGHIYEIQPFDEENMTQAEINGRKNLPVLMEFLRKYVPGAEKAVLAASGPSIGTRESRRIVGEYCLTAEDYANRADFEDAIGYYSYPIDMHAAAKEEREGREEVYQSSKYKMGEAYAIPYRSLLSIKFTNLLTAGRTISCDRAMQASVRVMPACFITGQAAGTAAAISTEQGCSVKDIDVKILRQRLKEQGACLKKGTPYR